MHEIEGEIEDLVEILSQMVEDREPLVLELLDIICERFSEQKTEENCWPDQVKVLVSCKRHPGDHLVSRHGFYYLELVEGAMGTTLQKAKEVEDDGGSIFFTQMRVNMQKLSFQESSGRKSHCKGFSQRWNT